MNQPEPAMPAPGSKGARTRARIVAEALAVIEEQGLAALSQETVARRAGLSQSALRHHFPMKEDMIAAVFVEAFHAFYRQAEQELLRPEASPREKLVRLIDGHLDFIARTSDRIALESFAHSARDVALRGEQSRWYAWLAEHYAALLVAARPELPEDEARDRSIALLTLCLGAWIASGTSRPEALAAQDCARRGILRRQAERLIDA